MTFPKVDFLNLSIVKKNASNIRHSAIIGKDVLRIQRGTT
ncbi:hypothetical protein LEP1GSC021_0387 [Leptospira noguchii str. 1993005606]|uniref:Uncharacterized protein n=2 Tax=Leptospira noguchii TaxID=28182 RepID=M6YAX4_9LEPT|nr:hypothetical protein LEP1GSC035_4622 [Leptospira noguchii str. 2007001578]EMO90915.1 hypothetical protein LEP1GSC024_0421 [Leptospira noguchii str. 2001034031]EPE84293.1 hypothetical protein LEP1GSC021_0387 [Leptospira noguchii str. 1993005606]